MSKPRVTWEAKRVSVKTPRFLQPVFVYGQLRGCHNPAASPTIGMQVCDSLQNLTDQAGCILLGVVALLRHSVKNGHSQSSIQPSSSKVHGQGYRYGPFMQHGQHGTHAHTPVQQLSPCHELSH